MAQWPSPYAGALSLTTLLCFEIMFLTTVSFVLVGFKTVVAENSYKVYTVKVFLKFGDYKGFCPMNNNRKMQILKTSKLFKFLKIIKTIFKTIDFFTHQ